MRQSVEGQSIDSNNNDNIIIIRQDSLIRKSKSSSFISKKSSSVSETKTNRISSSCSFCVSYWKRYVVCIVILLFLRDTWLTQKDLSSSLALYNDKEFNFLSLYQNQTSTIQNNKTSTIQINNASSYDQRLPIAEKELKQEQQLIQQQSTPSLQYNHPPPLDSLIGKIENSTDDVVRIIGDVQFLLDFAIIGFPKTGTTSMLRWLSTSFANSNSISNSIKSSPIINKTQILMIPSESFILQKSPETDMVRKLYHLEPEYIGDILFDRENFNRRKELSNELSIYAQELQAHFYNYTFHNYLRGYKAPNDIENVRPLRLLRTYWPKTKLIIGIRHPILWFESFYNFRVQLGKLDILHPKHLQRCIGGGYGVCVDRCKYHLHLAALGKTNYTTSKEEMILLENDYTRFNNESYIYQPNPIFLYDIDQLKSSSGTEEDKNSNNDNTLSLFHQFQTDLKSFLNLYTGSNTNEVSSNNTIADSGMPHVKPGINTAGSDRIVTNITLQNLINSKKINICDEEYDNMRTALLLKTSQQASRWISNFFLASPDVVVSPNKTYFVNNIMNKYMVDPCIERNKNIDKATRH